MSMIGVEYNEYSLLKFRVLLPSVRILFYFWDAFLTQVDDQELQDEPLQVRLMDHDTYSANDAIGKVYVDLNPLLLPPPSPPHSQRHQQDPSQPGVLLV